MQPQARAAAVARRGATAAGEDEAAPARSADARPPDRRRPEQVWAIDFVSDQTADGRPIKILTVTDEHTREALATPAARRMGADDTVSVLERIVEQRGQSTRADPLRQRPRVHQPGTQRLVPLQQRRHRLHRTRSTLAESVRRVLQRPPETRAARDGKLQQPVRSAAAPRGLATRLQPLPTTPILELPNTRRVRPPLEDRQPTRTLITTGPKNGVRSASLRAGTLPPSELVRRPGGH